MVLKIDGLIWSCIVSGYCCAKMKGTYIYYCLSPQFWDKFECCENWELKSLSLAPCRWPLQKQETAKPHISSYLNPVNRDLIAPYRFPRTLRSCIAYNSNDLPSGIFFMPYVLSLFLYSKYTRISDDWRDGSVVKSENCSFNEHKFSSRRLCWGAQKCL